MYRDKTILLISTSSILIGLLSLWKAFLLIKVKKENRLRFSYFDFLALR